MVLLAMIVLSIDRVPRLALTRPPPPLALVRSPPTVLLTIVLFWITSAGRLTLSPTIAMPPPRKPALLPAMVLLRMVQVPAPALLNR